MSPTRIAVAVVLAAALAACAPEVVRQPASIAAGVAAPRSYVTTAPVSFYLVSGYRRSVADGTTLVEVGTLAQGRVLKPTNTVFSVEGSQVHEAYLVVSGSRLAGFYLPVERAFTPLEAPVDLPLKER